MKIQISLSTKCNINCRFCLKEHLKRYYNFIENIDMDEELACRIVKKRFDGIQICSNRGEALMHPSIDNILKTAKINNSIIFVTNASLKNKKWWADLANLFDDKDKVIFPLDGIGNKSHNKHRQSDFYIVLNNIETFVNNGGKAIWRYILFEYNQDQVETAKRFAKDIGVEFSLMNSHSYDNKLKKPKEYKKSIKKNMYFPCEHQELYINVKGYLFPCCFMANIFGNEPLRKKHHEIKLVDLYNKEIETTNVNNNDIEFIINNSSFFKESMKKYSSICKGFCYNWTNNQLGE